MAVFLIGNVAVTVWIAGKYQRSDDFFRRHSLSLLMVAALPLAQASLLSMWIAGGRLLSYVRVPIAVVALTALWAVECQSLGLELADDRCAAHALMFAVQTILVSGLLVMMRVCRWLTDLRRDCEEPEKPESRVQFSVGFVLGWTTAIGLALGAWKLVLMHSNWPLEAVKGELFLFGAVVGAYNALFALIVLAGVSWGRRWWRVALQVLLALGLVGAVACSQSAVLTASVDEDGNVKRAAWIFLAGFQAVYLLISLVPIRLSGYNHRRTW